MTVEAFAICPVVGILVLLAALGRTAPDQRRIVALGFVAHVFGAFAIVLYHDFFYGGGDMLLFAAHGEDLARLIRWDPGRYLPEVLKLAAHLENDIPVFITMAGTGTGTMAALMGLLMTVVGDTIYGASLLVSFLSFYGLVRLYNALEWKLHEAERRPVLIGVLFVPSAVFWCSGVVKEAFVVAFLGILAAAVVDVLGRRRVTAIPVVVFAAVMVALVKPYVLVPAFLAVGGWFYTGRGRKLSLLSKAAGVIIAIAGVVAITKVFPEFALDKLGAEVARHQRNYLTVEGGSSNIDIGDVEDDAADRSLLSHARYAPLALINALLRPMPFDIHNVATFFGAIEMMVLGWLVFDLIRRNGVRRVIEVFSSRPQYVAALWFLLPFALSVGLTTRNLGTLSRYRVPAMPLYFMMLLGMRAALRPSSKVAAVVRGQLNRQSTKRRPRTKTPAARGILLPNAERVPRDQ